MGMQRDLERLPFMPDTPPPPGVGSLLCWWLGGGALALIVLMLLRRIPVHWRRRTAVARAAALSGYTVLIALLLLESFFHLGFVRTDIACTTLSSRAWFFKYWHPINDAGYRDIPHDAAHLSGKKCLLVVGDSFAAGHGIEDVADRFSNLTQQKLPAGWQSVTLAQPGWDTEAEFDALSKFPYSPSAVVLSVYQNDLERIAEDHGFEYQPPIQLELPAAAKWLAEHSYAASFCYWSIVIRYLLKEGEGSYLEYIHKVQADEGIWRDFAKRLEAFVLYAREREIPLVVVSFPMLQAPHITDEFDRRVRQYCTDEKVTVIDVRKLVEDIPPSERIINSLDPHPSKAVHRRVAEALWNALAPKLQ